MKLNLNHQKITSLSSSEMADIHGGGIKRSNRRNGNCQYSRDHPEVCDCVGKNGPGKLVVGCVAAAPSTATPSGS
ncbi:MAG: hypothetical protein ACFB10_20720 [Salibacteraceae bacterium]